METIAQYAERMKVTPNCVRWWIARGLIQAVRLGPKATMVIAQGRPKVGKRGRKSGSKNKKLDVRTVDARTVDMDAHTVEESTIL